MSNSFYYIFRCIQKNTKLAILIAILFLLTGAWLAKKIVFNEDISRIIPQDETESNSASILNQMSFTDKISIIITKNKEATDEDLIESAELFLDTISSLNSYYYNIQGVLDEDIFQRSFEFVYANLPIYLNEADYEIIQNRLNKDSISSQISSNYDMLTSGGGSFMKELIINDPLQLSRLALKKLQDFQGSNKYDFSKGYLFSHDHSKIYLFINPKFAGSETKNNEVFVDKLKLIQQHINEIKTDTQLHYFGAPIIAVANAKQIKQDIIATISLSISLLMLLLIFYYRTWYIPVVVMIPSVFGGLFGLLCLYFFKSEISAISLSISAILIGITVDYALHFLTHSKSNQSDKKLFKDVSKPLLMSSSTTAVAFLCLLFVRSEALIDLGIFASISVVATAVFTLIIIPHIYKGKSIQHTHVIDKIAHYPFEKNKILIACTLLLIIGSLFTYQRVQFDGDLSKINFVPRDQQNAEKLLNEGQVNKSIFIATYHDHPDSLLALNSKISSLLKKSPYVNHLQSISTILPSLEEQTIAIARWKQFWNHQKISYTKATIESESRTFGFYDDTHKTFYDALSKPYETINIQTLKEFDEQLYREFIHGKNANILSGIVTIKPENREKFIQSIESQMNHQQSILIDRQALNEQYLGFLVQDFNTLVGYSFLAVILILLVFYRRIELVIVSSIPIALTGLITAGLMGFFNIPFNIFSTIVCTLIFGHGIDFTIFMTSALQKQYTNGEDEMPTYRTSIILAVLTTILAIGALIFAQHPALKSISAIALIGVSAAVLVTFVLYPILFNYLFTNRIKKGLSPITLWLLVQSVFLLSYFALASLLTSVFMRSIFWLLPLSKERKWDLYGKWMSAYMRSVLYLKPQTSKKIYEKEKLKIGSQSIFIANHTSFLDTLSMGMLNPKIIFVVNNWVYQSPIFGRAVRFLGFFPVSSGIQDQLTSIRQRIGTTFSPMVFPEGTRSLTSEILRFHKGAFLLSEQLKLPIQPIFIHGNADSLPKGDFVIYNNFSHIHIADPIDPNDLTFGVDYKERTRNISKYFKKRFKEIRLRHEGPEYFKQKLFLNYLYKEYEIGKSVKNDFLKHKDMYHHLFHHIDEKANIAHITEDMGQIDFLLTHQFPTRKIRTYNLHEEHRAVSKSSYILNKFNIKYVDNETDLWKNQSTLLLSHLSSLDIIIPEHINEVVVLCCDNKPDFINFTLVSEENKLLIYRRNEAC